MSIIKSSEVYFKNVELNGVATSWDENGQKTIVSTLKNDKFDGKWIEWYEDGQIKSKATYKDGKCFSGDCD